MTPSRNQAGTDSGKTGVRARTLHEAILWHGGEGDAARQAYLDLPPGQRKALRAFLRPL